MRVNTHNANPEFSRGCVLLPHRPTPSFLGFSNGHSIYLSNQSELTISTGFTEASLIIVIMKGVLGVCQPSSM